MPVPASRISVLPSESSISTQEVLPPKRFISGPGAGTDPLAPQTFSLIVASSVPSLHLLLAVAGPEEDHRPLLHLLGHDRQRAHLDLVLGPAHGVDHVLGVSRAPLAKRLGDGELVVGDRVPVLVEWAERLPPLRGGHPPRLLERHAEQRPRGLVVEEKLAVTADEEGRR